MILVQHAGQLKVCCLERKKEKRKKKLCRLSSSQLVQTAASTAGLPTDGLPGLSAHPAVVPFVQGSLMLLGTGCSLALLLALGSRNKRTAGKLPAHAAVMMAGAISLWTVVML